MPEKTFLDRRYSLKLSRLLPARLDDVLCFSFKFELPSALIAANGRAFAGFLCDAGICLLRKKSNLEGAACRNSEQWPLLPARQAHFEVVA